MDKEKREAPEKDGSSAASAPPKRYAKERLYDKIPLSVKQLDIILIVLAIAFVVFLVLGALVGNGVLPEWFDLF